MISKMQGPVYPGGLSVCKSELGLGRDVLIGDDALHWFDGLSKTLDCILPIDLVHPLSRIA